MTPRTKVGRNRAAAVICPVVRRDRGNRSQVVVELIGRPDGTTAEPALHPPIEPPSCARVMKPVARATAATGSGATLRRVTTLAPDKEPACPGPTDARRRTETQLPDRAAERTLAVREVAFRDVSRATWDS